MRFQRKWMLAAWMAVVVFGAAMAAHAQPPGDSNADGVVNGSDLPGLAACMGGPNSTASSACAATFAVNPTNYYIGLRQAMAQSAAAARNAGCLAWGSEEARQRFLPPGGIKRGYVFENKYYPTPALYAAAADIDTYHRPPLCLQPTGDVTAFSVRCVSIGGSQDTALKWHLQMGAATRRRWAVPQPPPTTTVTTDTYCELFQGQDWTITFIAAPAQSARYEVRWNNSSGRQARWYQDGVLARIEPNHLIPHEQAIFAGWQGETLNTADLMSGRPSDPCKFRNCTWDPGSAGNTVPVAFFAEEFTVFPTYLYGLQVQAPGADGFDIWDHWP